MFTHFRYIFKIPARASGIQRRAAPTHFPDFSTTDSQCSSHTGLSITRGSEEKKKNQALGCFQHVQGSQAVRPQNQRICLTLLCLKLLYLWSRDHASGQRRTVMITSELWTLVHSLPYHGPHHHNLCILFPYNSPENKSSIKNVSEISFF